MQPARLVRIASGGDTCATRVESDSQHPLTVLGCPSRGRSPSRGSVRTGTEARQAHKPGECAGDAHVVLLARPLASNTKQPVGEGDGASLPSAQPPRSSSARERAAHDADSTISRATSMPGAPDLSSLAIERLPEHLAARVPEPERAASRPTRDQRFRPRYRLGQMPDLPGARIPFGSRQSLSLLLKRASAPSFQLNVAATASISEVCVRYSP